MTVIVFVLLAMSVLQAIWEPAAPAKKVRGAFNKSKWNKSNGIANEALVGDAV